MDVSARRIESRQKRVLTESEAAGKRLSWVAASERKSSFFVMSNVFSCQTYLVHYCDIFQALIHFASSLFLIHIFHIWKTLHMFLK